MDLMQEIADQELPRSMAYEWTELTTLQLQAGNTAMFVFGLAVMFVFLVLAAQYESWSLPLAVILVVPMCLFCSIVGVQLAGMEVNIFTQIGFVVLVGLASKNAILIVEFAKQQQEAGVPRRQATRGGLKLRLRPILMTSFAFILGVVPLVIAAGAGAEMRRSLGTGRLQRHAGRDALRHLPDAGLLLRHSAGLAKASRCTSRRAQFRLATRHRRRPIIEIWLVFQFEKAGRECVWSPASSRPSAYLRACHPGFQKSNGNTTEVWLISQEIS